MLWRTIMSDRNTNEKAVVVMVVNSDGSQTIKRVTDSKKRENHSRMRQNQSKALSRAVFG